MMNFEIENELITFEELNTFEQKLSGFKLPQDYKEHMLKYNGGGVDETYVWYNDPDIEFLYFYPIKFEDENMESALIDREGVLPESDIYFGAIRGGALCMTLTGNTGLIYVLYSDGERIDLASSFTEFVKGLILEE